MTSRHRGLACLPKISAELSSATAEVLRLVPNKEIIERVTIVSGYLQLATMDPKNLDQINKLSHAVFVLAGLVGQRGHSSLAERLRSLARDVEKPC